MFEDRKWERGVALEVRASRVSPKYLYPLTTSTEQ